MTENGSIRGDSHAHLAEWAIRVTLGPEFRWAINAHSLVRLIDGNAEGAHSASPWDEL